MNVHGTGAKPIYYRGSPISASYLAENRTYEFIYNGTQYDLVGDINTAHNHLAGVGLTGSGSSGTGSGIYTYKAKLKDEAANANDSLARPTANANRLYPVEVDKSGYLAVTVPWDIGTDTKNTAGATNTSSKIYLIGAKSQEGDYQQTYSQDTAYVDIDGCLYSGGKKVLTSADIDDKNYAKLNAGNTFIGVGNRFTQAITGQKGFIVTNDLDLQNNAKYFHDRIEKQVGSNTYTLTIPSKTGTIVTTSDLSNYVNRTDIQSVAGNKTFTGATTFSGSVTCKVGVLATNGDNTLDNTNFSYDSITRYKDSKIYKLTIPLKGGTIATLDDLSNYVSTTDEIILDGGNAAG